MPSGPLVQSSLLLQLPFLYKSFFPLRGNNTPSPSPATSAAHAPPLMVLKTPPLLEYHISSHSHINNILDPSLPMDTSISSCARNSPSTPPISADKDGPFPAFLQHSTPEYAQFNSLLNACINIQQVHSDFDNSTSASDAANYDRSTIKYDQEVSSMVSGRELDSDISSSLAKKYPKDNAIKYSQIIDDDGIDLSSCFSVGWRGLKRTRSKRRSRNSSKFPIGTQEERSINKEVSTSNVSCFSKKKRSAIVRSFSNNSNVLSKGRSIDSSRSVLQDVNETISGVTSDVASTKDGSFYKDVAVSVSTVDMMLRTSISSTTKLDQLALIACELTNTVSKRRRTPRKRRQHIPTTAMAEIAISAGQHCSKINYINTIDDDFIRSNVIVRDGQAWQAELCSKVQSNYIRKLDQEVSALAPSTSSCNVIQTNLPRLRSMLIKKNNKKDRFSSSSSINSFQTKKKIIKQRLYSRRQKDTRIQRCAKRVLDFVGKEVIHEKVIRQSLGNNPDTSKALRLLLNQRKLGRVGAGGRKDPYKYKATQSGLLEEPNFSGVSHDIIQERSAN